MDKFLRSGVTAGFLLSAGFAQAAQRTLVAIDSSGQTVGAITSEGLVSLRLKPNLDLVQMRIQPSQLGSEGNEYYTTTDCTGDVYLISPSLFRNGYLMRADPGTIIFANTNAPPVKVQSYLQGKSGFAQCYPVYQDITPPAYPVLKTRVDVQGLTPPFSVKLK